LLEQLGSHEIDRAECIAARPDPDIHPDLWWIGCRVYQELLAKMGYNPATDEYMRWPGLPVGTGPIGLEGICTSGYSWPRCRMFAVSIAIAGFQTTCPGGAWRYWETTWRC
jgi:hypothetical protein